MLQSLPQTLTLGCGITLCILNWLVVSEDQTTSPRSSAPPRTPISHRVGHNGEKADSRESDAFAPEGLGAHENAVREIVEFRNQQQNLFGGTMLGSMDSAESEEAFVEALRDVMTRRGPSPSTSSQPPLDADSESPRTKVCVAAYREQVAQQQERASSAPRHRDKATDMTLVTALRRACRQLDRKSNDLEEMQQYDTADHLREFSQELRNEARKWSPLVPASPVRQAQRLPVSDEAPYGAQ